MSMLFLSPLGLWCLYRLSSTPRDGTCIAGVPRDVTLPVMLFVGLHNAYAAIRICLPLFLCSDDRRVRAQAIHSAIAVILCICATCVTFTLVVVFGEYFYYTYILCIMLSVLMLMSVAAFIMTWKPAYKDVALLRKQPLGQTAKQKQSLSYSDYRSLSEAAPLISSEASLRLDHRSGPDSPGQIPTEFMPAGKLPTSSHFRRWHAQQSIEYGGVTPSETTSWSSAATPDRGSIVPTKRRGSSPCLYDAAYLHLSDRSWDPALSHQSLHQSVELAELQNERRRVAPTDILSDDGGIHAQMAHDDLSNTWRPPTPFSLGSERSLSEVDGSHNAHHEKRSPEFLELQGLPSPAARAAFLSAPVIRGRTSLRGTLLSSAM
ncbi:hypothetical protein BCR37DRAFT_385100 [Protomyces lactucae-debilis]|uniref:G-protein coupled receptors family 3 profile domain-containing protein n=1 Tax=Protomyces lactucae-debilis TaxID=2754530 RepID=A0A1Y2FV03_PROLT|nr:uncharacterized protein BCR37DRAFT_385100 [Protomyces lactucae-debilis]ORY87828.1 hypothetical protein BCR37DRAFT_385100 [Protomyces lactucae-debilis]